ncbi:NAD(+)/NADH kinase [Anaerosacchariphilus sp. NSJ-68]|uniref:NAD kinase n=2 Tax=Lachnospiraceae TaxID=186803 RepID=A0A923LDF8_9FIRM|nr:MULTISPECIES: NAD(+)/NADH kinase [Lachnospiraceae]MBC5660077.1 NAD(+)/NADH kinase [Anaerosacchariphilus hominis]MBC5699192.1 NAD(+)/NADH kinase [Roseburia difficilis]
MNRFYVITNSEKDKNLETTDQIYQYLKSRGCECTVREYQKKDEVPGRGNYRYTDAELIPEGTECILVLGGDGTLIQAARDTVNRNIPLLGVNLGTLGFLAEIEKSGISEALDSLILDNYTIEPRMLLEGTVHRADGDPVRNLALNDIVVNRAGALRIIDYEVEVNGEKLNRYSADGMIVSTPTGSTGYSLSAGGPIVSPMASMIVVTPICPHTLTARSIVLSGGDRVTIRAGAGRRNHREEAFVTFDGEVQVPVATGDYVEIQKSEKTVNILKISRVSFLEVLRDKMRGN